MNRLGIASIAASALIASACGSAPDNTDDASTTTPTTPTVTPLQQFNGLLQQWAAYTACTLVVTSDCHNAVMTKAALAAQTTGHLQGIPR